MIVNERGLNIGKKRTSFSSEKQMSAVVSCDLLLENGFSETFRFVEGHVFKIG